MGVLGGLVATAPLAALVTATGWRSALVLIGVVTVAGAALCHAVVLDHPGARAAVAPPVASLREVLAGTRRVLGNPRTWPPFFIKPWYTRIEGRRLRPLVPACT